MPYPVIHTDSGTRPPRNPNSGGLINGTANPPYPHSSENGNVSMLDLDANGQSITNSNNNHANINANAVNNATATQQKPHSIKTHTSQDSVSKILPSFPMLSQGGHNVLLYHHHLKKLNYDIHSWSSHSASYHPKNIKVDKPMEQSSRWSSGSNNQLQYITIKLDKVAIAYTITLGKYHKVHVCNMRDFKVYGGMTTDQMVEVLHAGLRNDSEPETFPLKFQKNGVIFPVRYIKIVPLMAWGVNFNYSIWYVEMRGVNTSEIVEKATEEYLKYQEVEAVRLCLKHLRQRNYLEAFHSLQKQSNICLEDPSLTKLHQLLVLNGDFDATEQLMIEAAESDMFNEYIERCQYKPKWRRIFAKDANGISPSQRGGHQMCCDPDAGMVYLFGGWDGTTDLSDFWSYNEFEERWFRISADTKAQGGPGPRSCHKICFDPATKQIYTLGRYIDPDSRANTTLEAEFFRYDIRRDTWIKISSNTENDGGPELIYDHQMCVDSERQVLWTFGGRVISEDATTNIYSGLYAYYIQSNRWELVRSDSFHPGETSNQLKSRIGHSMLFNPQDRQLYFFAGQRNKDYLSDFYIYDIDQDQVLEMSRDSCQQGGPEPGFTQRATIDVDRGEFYVLSGLMREKNNPAIDSVKNSFWVYDIRRNKWTKLYQNENTGNAYWTRMGDKEPQPRFAHQLVYDCNSKVHFLFGGNPGELNHEVRLDDFWELKLIRPSRQDILRKIRFLIRKQRFQEMCQRQDPLAAMKYLQTDLSLFVAHDDPRESAEFRKLTTDLFKPNESSKNPFQSRTALYELLLEFMPDGHKQPKHNLIDVCIMQKE